MDRKRIQSVEKLVGIAAFLCIIVGSIALLMAIVLFINGEYSASGLFLISAALGFGLFSIAVLNG